MKALDSIINIYLTQENNHLEHKGRFVNLHNSKRTNWNKRRNYGF